MFDAGVILKECVRTYLGDGIQASSLLNQLIQTADSLMFSPLDSCC